MKKISNVEVKLINLQANDILTTSDVAASIKAGSTSTYLVGGRDYYDDEEDF